MESTVFALCIRGCLLQVFLIFQHCMCSALSTDIIIFTSFHQEVHLSAEENSILNFTFSINNSINWNDVDFYKNGISQCTIRKRDNCTASMGSSVCHCTLEVDKYRFTRRVVESDKDVWTWKVSLNLDVVANGSLNLNITHPTNVTSLFVNNYTLDEYDRYQLEVNTSVQVICTWIDGNPPAYVRLLDNSGIPLKGITETQKAIYNISTTTCNDVINLRCEADGSEQNKSTQLVVACVPEFVGTSENVQLSDKTQTAMVQFQVRSLINITQCAIRQQANHNDSSVNVTAIPSESAKLYRCTVTSSNTEVFHNSLNTKCLCFVQGTEPNLTISILISNLREEDGGRWRVNVSNSLGSASSNFTLPILKEEKNKNGESSSTVFYIVGMGVAAFAVTIILCIIAVRQRRRKLLNAQVLEKDCNMRKNSLYVGSSIIRRSLKIPSEDEADGQLGMKAVDTDEKLQLNNRTPSAGGVGNKAANEYETIGSKVHEAPEDTSHLNAVHTETDH